MEVIRGKVSGEEQTLTEAVENTAVRSYLKASHHIKNSAHRLTMNQ